MEEWVLISAYNQGVLVLAVLLQDGVPALVGEGCLYLKQQVSTVLVGSPL